MPKAKTHKGLSKRVKITATGKVLRRKAGTSHLMSSKSGKRVRHLRKKTLIGSTKLRAMKRLLGY